MSGDWKWIAVERGRSIRMYVSLLENYGQHHAWCHAHPDNRPAHPQSEPECNCRFALELARGRSFVESMDAAPDVPEAEYVAYRTAVEVDFARKYPEEAEVGSCSVCGGINGKHGPVCPVAVALSVPEGGE